MIFPGFPGVPSFFQVFQVEWEPCLHRERYVRSGPYTGSLGQSIVQGGGLGPGPCTERGPKDRALHS